MDLNESYLALDEPYQKFNKLNEDLLDRIACVDDAYKKAEEVPGDEVNSMAPNYMETFLGP